MSYPGRPSRPWFIAARSGNQTTNIAVGNHIEFNTSFGYGGITLSSGGGQSDGIITLPQGYIFAIHIFIGSTADEGQTECRLVEHPADTAVATVDGGLSGVIRCADTNSATGGCPTNTSVVVVDTSSGSIQVKVEKINEIVAGFLQWFNASRVFIEVVG